MDENVTSWTVNLSSKYLDLTGLTRFWEKTKTYIGTQDAAVAKKAADDLATAKITINESISGINDVLDAMSVNGKSFKDYSNKIVLGAGDISYKTGMTVANAIAANEEAIATKVSSVEANSKTDALVGISAEDKDKKVTITLNEAKLQEKLSAIEATAGVVSLSVEGSDDNSLVAVEITKGTVQTDGSSKGEITITVNEEKLSTKFSGVEQAIKDNADAIKDNADAIKANGEAIEDLKSSTITSVDEATNSVENYVSLNVSTADKKVTLKLDDSTLTETLSEVASDIEHLEGLTINGIPAYTTGAGNSKNNKVTIGADDISYKTGVTVADAIATNEAKIAALASATHFIGVTKTELTDGSTTQTIVLTDNKSHIAQDGDIVIYGNGEFIWSDGKWFLLGDTTAESARISALEDWVSGNAITAGEIDALFNEGEATS